VGEEELRSYRAVPCTVGVGLTRPKTAGGRAGEMARVCARASRRSRVCDHPSPWVVLAVVDLPVSGLARGHGVATGTSVAHVYPGPTIFRHALQGQVNHMTAKFGLR